jgi:hypothetical protein
MNKKTNLLFSMVGLLPNNSEMQCFFLLVQLVAPAAAEALKNELKEQRNKGSWVVRWKLEKAIHERDARMLQLRISGSQSQNQEKNFFVLVRVDALS